MRKPEEVVYNEDLIMGFLFVRELMVNLKAQLLATDLDYDEAIRYIEAANAHQGENTISKSINSQTIEALRIAKELHPILEASHLEVTDFDRMLGAEDNGVQ
jgi:hypothetical protein